MKFGSTFAEVIVKIKVVLFFETLCSCSLIDASSLLAIDHFHQLVRESKTVFLNPDDILYTCSVIGNISSITENKPISTVLFGYYFVVCACIIIFYPR